MLLNLLIPFVLTVGSGSKGKDERTPSLKSLLILCCAHEPLCCFGRQPPPRAARDIPAPSNRHQHPAASPDHLHLPHQELHAGRVAGSLLHPWRRWKGPAQGGTGGVHQPGCVPGYDENFTASSDSALMLTWLLSHSSEGGAGLF